MSQSARRCPECGQLNFGLAEFCARCGASLAMQEPRFLPWSESGALPPLAPALREDARTFARVNPEAAGAGLVSSGLVVVTAGLLIDLSPIALVLLVAAGLALVMLGLWQLRIDYGSLSRLGVWLALVAALCLVLVAWRVVEPGTPNPVALIRTDPTSTPREAAQLTGDGEALMHRGGPDHRGTNVGPAPTGSLFRLWRFDTGGELYSSPAISGNTLVVGSKRGTLYGLNATTGEQLWARELGQYIVRSSPAIAGERVIINNGYEVIALALADGKTLWTVPVAFTGNTSPTVANDIAYIASQNGSVQALAVDSGKEQWKVQIEGLIFGSPTVDDGHLYVANDQGAVVGIRLDSGAVLWRAEVNGGVFAPIVSSDGIVYLTTSNGSTVALDGTYGQEQWSYDAGGSSGGALSVDTLVVGADTGGITSLGRTDGTLKWLVPTGSQVTVGPVIVGNLAIVASGQTIYGLDLKTGEQRFTYGAGYTIQIAPVVVNGLMYVGGRDGYLDAIAGDDGVPTA